MADWDDDDDDWDIDEDEMAVKLNNFDDEKDLTLEEEKKQQATQQALLKKKGQALAAKKQAEQERKDEMEIARKAMELEAEMESKMTIDKRRELERKRVKEADNAFTDDLFGAVDSAQTKAKAGAQAGDTVVMKTLADHMKHARKVACSLKVSRKIECLQKFIGIPYSSKCALQVGSINSRFAWFLFVLLLQDGGKIHMASAFFINALQQSKDVLDDAAISEIIKTCNVIKNEKVQAAKRKVKGQAQKSKKADKAAAARAKKIQDEVFGDSNKYDAIDEMGAAYEDEYDFF